MSKFLIIGDLHLRSSAPEMRVEPDFQNLCLGKLRFILNKAQQLECDAVLQPGDFFDSPNPTAKLLIQVTQAIKESGVYVIATVGNHDVTGKNASLYKEESPLGLLEAAEAIRVLSSGDYEQVGDCVVRGYSYGEKLTDDFVSGKGKKATEDFEIALIHASVGASRQEAQVDINEQNIRGADIAVFGDIHFGWNGFVEHKSGCCSFNPGCAIRLRSTEKDLSPRCIFIDTDKWKESKEYWEINIPHQPAKYSFNLKQLDKRADDRLDAWNAAHAKSLEIQQERPEDMVRRVAGSVGYNEDVVQVVLDKLGEIK